jgi:DMSO/TMAO reductase YedYZ molybdopterin-dependent catalytic subunit
VINDRAPLSLVSTASVRGQRKPSISRSSPSTKPGTVSISPDAYHPQTFLAYGLNGQELPLDHGAPLRLRVARQHGYKSVKYLQKITVTDSRKHIGDGRGSAAPAAGYSWYAGI